MSEPVPGSTRRGQPGDAKTSATGLTQAQASERLAADGANELPVSRPRGVLRLLREVVTEPMFLLLVACGMLYLLLGNRQEALMLLGFVFVVMGITFFQQRRTERSLDALRSLSSPQATVIRDGTPRKISGRDLVQGDLVLLAEGDRIPADIELIETSTLAVDESLLTGESVPVAKDVVAGAAGAVLVFSGTLVTQGTARGTVVATGERSALGRIGKSMSGLLDESTPIQRETSRVVKQVAGIGLALACVLAAANWMVLGDWRQGLLAGLTLAMAILPEELPVVLTIFLGLGAWRLARENVLARSIPAVEVLGATTVLCVDKTGTLTANRMVVRKLWSPLAAYDVASASASSSASPGALQEPPLQEALHGTLEYAVLASHRRAFDPMETAIGEAGQSLLANTEHLHSNWTLVDDYPLSREMLAMSRVWQSPDLSERLIASKGAPEAIVDLCHLDEAQQKQIAAQAEVMAGQGLRVLGVAQARFGATVLPETQHDFDFEFLGLIALEDPVRADVPKAIAECQAAGIRVVMMTGDHPATAMAIARQVGLPEGQPAMTGLELASLDDAALSARLATTHVFCRVQPEQKLRLVQAFRARGDVVAMTGDGVNDAPALKAANIGVAMGARGTEVAREAADLVLLADDFSSIVTAVRYGRRVFANLRKAFVFVVAAHLPIIGLSLIPVLMGWPMLLMPVHILFLQLIIDPACSVVFEAEPLEAGAMHAMPRSPDARLFDPTVLLRGFLQGLGLLALLLGVYATARSSAFSGGQSEDSARALTFMVLVLANLGLIHANRSWDHTRWAGPVQGNRYFRWITLATLVTLACILGIGPVRGLFAFAALTPLMVAVGIGTVLLAFVWFEAVKAYMRWRMPVHA